MATAIIGSTGLVGSNILSTLINTEPARSLLTITRRAPKSSSPHLNAVIDADTTKWASILSSTTPLAQTVFSALGTTRAQAGGLANQWKIDHDLNVELAEAAKKAGTRTFVFISSAGTRSLFSSFVPYSKMKIGVEDKIRDLDFEHSVILRPGMILGTRETPHGGMGEAYFQSAVRGLNRVGMQDSLGQEAEVIARAAVRAAQLVEEGKAPSKYWILEQADIIRLGRTEWKGEASAEKK